MDCPTSRHLSREVPLKEKKTGKSPEGSRSKSEKPVSTPSTPRNSGSATDTVSTNAPVPGITKKTRPELVALASSLGLPVKPLDRRIDLIERIRNLVPRSQGTKSPKKAIPEASHRPEIPLAKPSTPDTIEPSRQNAPPPPLIRSAPGWRDFIDIPYEPVRREHRHFVTILPVSPYRIIAFFGVDRGSEPGLASRIDASGLVLKIRDVTGAVSRRERKSDLPADHVFDIMAGMADRWHIPLWSAHRWMEAWLGFYDNGSFQILARSKRIRTPRGGPSPRTGSLFHLREASYMPYSPTEIHERELLMRYYIKLPTSGEVPASSAQKPLR